MMAQLIAHIQCRRVGGGSPGHDQPGEGFLLSIASDGMSSPEPASCLVIPFYVRGSFTFGRDPDPQVNLVYVDNPCISKRHFEIYSVVYEENNTAFQPMIYVRDRQSLSGTLVNGIIIGSKAHGVTPGYLLSQGDIITINPFWEFAVSLQDQDDRKFPLNQTQFLEAEAFNDRYCITDRILGRGNYGNVHLAMDIRSGKQVCCKIVNLNRVRGPTAHEVVKSFVREALVLARVRHPNLLTFECAFRSKHTIYVFTELASGGDLFSMLVSQGGALSKVQVKFVIHQVVRGVAYLHKQGIAHRDLKAENIFLANGPNTMTRVIIGDLGHAKGINWGRLVTTVGTEMYQAPELHFHHDFYTESVDIWALGILILFLLNFSPMDTVASLKCVDQGSIDVNITNIFASASVQEALCHDGQDFVRRCLQVEPKLRMTATDAKRHPWLRLSQREIDAWTEVRKASWKPTCGSPPRITELPEIRNLETFEVLERANKTTSLRPTSSSLKQKRTTGADQLNLDKETEKSKYFQQPAQGPSKKLKMNSTEKRSFTT